jgi:hypothetical protein
VDTEPATDPREQAVDRRHERQNGEHIAEDLAGNDETENGALREGM